MLKFYNILWLTAIHSTTGTTKYGEFGMFLLEKVNFRSFPKFSATSDSKLRVNYQWKFGAFLSKYKETQFQELF